MNGDFSNKNGGKQSFNAPFSASHLEKTRISASDFASQSRTNEKPPVVRRGNPKRIQNRQSSAAATQNACRTAGHLPLVHLGIHPGHYRRMSGGNSYVFEISGGNSHTIQQVPSRKRMQIRHSFSGERKPPVAEKHAGSRPPTHGGQLPIGLEKHTAQHWPSQSARTPASRSPSGRVPDASPQ